MKKSTEETRLSWIETKMKSLRMGDDEDRKKIMQEIIDYGEEIKKHFKLPIDEMWDEYSERIDTDIDSLQFFAGRDVMTKEKFNKMMNFVLAVTPNEVQAESGRNFSQSRKFNK